ncbi:MAG: hypothetical protein U0W40_01935 [Acidimicrobiia bacterium]
MLHALCALVHVQLVARHPFVAELGTELARRQNSLAITLLNSREPGSGDVSLIAPDGPGTIPGGAESMQTPDFWSIPFVSGARSRRRLRCSARCWRSSPAAAPPYPEPVRYDQALGEWLSAGGLRGALSPRAQYDAAVALGLLP